jgi:siderophore synthetase component
MDSTPPISTWIKKVVGGDAFLQNLGFTLLCEVATVGYHNFYYERFGRTCAYNKMLAALWRESPASVMQPGQQLMTMAALLHVDFEGNALLPELIKASGKTASEWIRQYLRCYLTPLVHCFYQHDLVFMPHGENLILVMENQFPVKAIMKDITEEICVFNKGEDMPDKAKRICMEIPEDLKSLSILTDVFDCFFRFLNQILVAHCDFEEQEFWRLVAENLQEYQQAYPQLAEKFERYDLFASEFTLSCLNRLQLRNHKQMVDLADPVGNLQFVGTLQNPIAPYKILSPFEASLLKSEAYGLG